MLRVEELIGGLPQVEAGGAQAHDHRHAQQADHSERDKALERAAHRAQGPEREGVAHAALARAGTVRPGIARSELARALLSYGGHRLPLDPPVW